MYRQRSLSSPSVAAAVLTAIECHGRPTKNRDPFTGNLLPIWEFQDDDDDDDEYYYDDVDHDADERSNKDIACDCDGCCIILNDNCSLAADSQSSFTRHPSISRSSISTSHSPWSSLNRGDNSETILMTSSDEEFVYSNGTVRREEDFTAASSITTTTSTTTTISSGSGKSRRKCNHHIFDTLITPTDNRNQEDGRKPSNGKLTVAGIRQAFRRRFPRLTG